MLPIGTPLHPFMRKLKMTFAICHKTLKLKPVVTICEVYVQIAGNRFTSFVIVFYSTEHEKPSCKL